MSQLTVIDHHHDPDAGIYRLTLGVERELPDGEVEYVPVEDFVFADDDKRWEGMSLEQVTAEQRRAVRDALAAREAARAEHESAEQARSQLPGVGEAL